MRDEIVVTMAEDPAHRDDERRPPPPAEEALRTDVALPDGTVPRGQDDDDTVAPPTSAQHLLLERSPQEFRNQVEAAYISKTVAAGPLGRQGSSGGGHPIGATATGPHVPGGGDTAAKGSSSDGGLTASEVPERAPGESSSVSRRPLLEAFKKVHDAIERGMGAFFYNHGRLVATHPAAAIILCLAVSALCGAGLVRFRAENNGLKLWIPRDSSQR